MRPLRRRMIEDMQIRNLSPRTQRAYVEQVVRFARHFRRSPEHLGPAEIPTYLLYLARVSAVDTPEGAVWRADHTASSWLDLAEGRLRFDRLRRNGGRETFFPWAKAHSSRDKKLSPPPSSTALQPVNGCVVDRLRLSDRHRGRGGRGLETAKER